MSAGLFDPRCPECGEPLHIDESGRETCAKCAHMYLNRLGYLIPVEDSGDVTGSSPAERPHFPQGAPPQASLATDGTQQ